MAEVERSVLLPPVELSTVAVRIFSLAADLPPDVEAEIDYFFGHTAPSEETSYRECFVPTEGHFPMLFEKVLGEVGASRADMEKLRSALNEELSQLRKAGILGNVVLPESLYQLVERKLASGKFREPMDLV
jgi:hypothetical protein